jgi:hypothetical protein
MKENLPKSEEIFNYYTGDFIGRVTFIVTKVRKGIYNRFLKITGIGENHTVLDVGVSAEHELESNNFFEQYYPYKNKITAVGIVDASYLEEAFPGVEFILGNGKSLPFDDSAFDYVFSNAVIEHVGSRDEQAKFISECYRVARKGVFIATPNRWFPVELHCHLPFVHWLPPKVFRKILFLLKKEPLYLEEYLNLLSSGELRRLCRSLSINDLSIVRQRLLGLTSNLALYIRKTP